MTLKIEPGVGAPHAVRVRLDRKRAGAGGHCWLAVGVNLENSLVMAIELV